MGHFKIGLVIELGAKMWMTLYGIVSILGFYLLSNQMPVEGLSERRGGL